MDFEQLKSNFATLNKQIEAAMAQMKADSQPLIEAAAQAMFAAAPEIKQVFWTQYTPYFNDGEPCSFGRGDFYFLLEGDDLDETPEGSTLYSESDYQDSLNRLEEVKNYVADPYTWFEKYKKTCNLSDNAKLDWYRPWPYTVERAQEAVDYIEAQRARISQVDTGRILEAFDSFVKTVQLIPDDIMESVYGDHVQVSITRQGTTVDHYDHD